MVVPNILSEVEVAHKFENKSERMRLGGINTNERYKALAGEAAMCGCFIKKPLQPGRQRAPHTPQLRVTHPTDPRVVCRCGTPVGLDCDLSIVQLADPNIGETSSADGTCPDDLEVFSS